MNTDHIQRRSLARARAMRYCTVALVAFAVCVTAWNVIPRAFGLTSPAARNYNEGWMVALTYQLTAGAPLYPDESSLTVNNYPPLWFLMSGLIAKSGLDLNSVARLLELSALFACGAFIFLILRQLSATVAASGIGAILFMGVVTAWLPEYIGINDPHFFGLALMLCGAWLSLRARGWTSLLLAALVICIAGFVKHSLIPIPASLALFFLATDFRRGAVFSAALLLFVAIGLAICTWVWGGDFWHGLFSPRVENAWKIRLHVETHPLYYLSMLAALALAVSWSRAGMKFAWPALFLLMSLLVAALIELAEGVSGNHFFDSLSAFCIIAGLAFSRSAERGFGGRGVMLLAAAILLIANFSHSWQSSIQYLATRTLRDAAARAARDSIAVLEGPVACEDALLCARAGKTSELDFFNIGQRLKTGKFTTDRLLAALEARKVGAVQFSSWPASSDRLPQADVQALLERYPEEVYSNEYYLVRARTPKSAATARASTAGTPPE